MQLRIYDAEFNFLGITENQTSVIWTRKYYESGEFSVVLPITDDNIRLYQIGNIVAKRDSIEAGVIEDLQIHESYDEHSITASGRFLSSYMDRRLIRPRYTFDGLVEVAMRNILSNAVAIPLVELGELQGFTDTVTFQATYKNLLAYETKLAKSAGLGFRFRPDFENKKIIFEVYQGLDKSRNQTDRAFVEFSDRFDNLENAEARLNDQLYKNVGYVGGQGEGLERVFVQVGDDTLTGLARRELFIDAKDIQEEDVGNKPEADDYMENHTATDGDGNTITYTTFDKASFDADVRQWEQDKASARADYLDELETRGYQKLDECLFSNSIECGIIPIGNFEYKRDYDLGDIVTVKKNNWNYENVARITEITEVYEHEIFNVVPTLGDALPEVVDWEDK